MEETATITRGEAKSLLDSVVLNTFESIFFVQTVPCSEEKVEKISGSDGLAVVIDIKSRFSGQITMFLSRESARRLVGTTLTSTTEISDELLADSFAEVLNTIGGRVASSIAQADFSFDLSIPKVSFGKVSISDLPSIRTCFEIEYGYVCFTFLFASYIFC